MHQTLIQCTALISAVTLTTLGAPTATYQTHDSSLLVEVAESINSEKISKKTFKMQYTSSLFDLYLIENPINMQSDNIDEISKCKMPEIGYISEYEFNLLCQLVAAEAENQCFEGKRAVVGVVLNRSEHGWPFEAGIEGAIFQEGAFSCISDGRFFTASEYVSDEDKEAVAAELSERKYSEYFYFTAGHYGEYGTPAEQIGDHYFCTL
jgi:spore germination cell wall hydrolase CwlJ-like protein